MSEIQNIQELFAIRDDYNKKVKAFGEDLLKKEFHKFFDSTPDVESVRWTQYTPGFNDGDPCVFGLGEFVYRSQKQARAVNAGEEVDSDYDEGYQCCYWYENEKADVGKESQDGLRKFQKLISDSEDVLEMIFGDGVQVTATRDKIETEDYDCGY